MESKLPTILLVERNHTDATRLEYFIRHELGYGVETVELGEAALLALEDKSIQIVIADWNLPDISGPELCQRIRQSQPDRYIYFILLTARSGVQSLRTGLQSGADDFIRKPLDFHELGLRIRAGSRIVSLEQSLKQRNQELDFANAEISRALRSAARTQQKMLPSRQLTDTIRQTTGLWIDHIYLASQSLGGDVLGIDQTESGSVVLFVADISGHGIEPSMAAVGLHSTIKSLAKYGNSMTSLITSANQYCLEELPTEVYATAALMYIDPESRLAEFVVAGHPPVLLASPDGSIRQFDSQMPPLGLFDDAAAGVLTHRIYLQPGERLVTYTDGVIESKNPAGELFSTDLLAERLSTAPIADIGGLPDWIVEQATRWRGPLIPAEDDVTVLVAGFEA